MKIKNMQWGESYVGFACGPMGGEVIVELEVTDNQSEQCRFVSVSQWDAFCNIRVSKVSVIERLRTLYESGKDFDQELASIDKVTDERYCAERLYWNDEEPDENKIDSGDDGFGVFDNLDMMNSRFAPAIQLALKALDILYSQQESSGLDAQQFAAEYLNHDTDEFFTEP